jgi:hypothetical protein
MKAHLPLPSLRNSDVVRFWSFVDRRESGECWPWLGCHGARGYGHLAVGRRHLMAHRLAYFLQHGVDPLDSVVRHTCDTPECVNGAHLLLGTYADNSRDMVARGRANTATGDKHGARTQPDRHARGEASGLTTLTAAEVANIRRRYAAGDVTYAELGVQFGISGVSVGDIVRGKRWAHLPYDRAEALAIGHEHRVRWGEHNTNAKLTEADVRLIRAEVAAGVSTRAELARRYGVTKTLVGGVVSGRGWKHVT